MNNDSKPNFPLRIALRILPVVLVCFLVGSTVGCNAISKLKARDQMVQGVRSFKDAQYTAASEHFKKAIQLDPELRTARLYLATAYAQQFIPGAESDDNVKMGQAAIDVFKDVLKEDPNNLNSIAGIASLLFQMKKLEDAKVWYNKQIAADPTNADSFYSVGVIDWTETYQPRMALRAQLHLDKPEEPISDKKARDALCEKANPIIADAFEKLNKAVALRPDYDDAMAYLNLMYREKADCEDTKEARSKDWDEAEKWVDKNQEIRKKKAAAAAAAPGAQPPPQ